MVGTLVVSNPQPHPSPFSSLLRTVARCIEQKGQPKTVSRCCRMVKAEVSAIVEACMEMVRAHNKEASRVSSVQYVPVMG